MRPYTDFINFCDEMMIAEEATYYRLTYNGIGIYQALKMKLTKTEDGRKLWRNFITTKKRMVGDSSILFRK